MSYHVLHKICAFMSIRLYKLSMWFTNIEGILKEKKENGMKKKDVIFWAIPVFIIICFVSAYIIPESKSSLLVTVVTICGGLLATLSAGISFNINKDKGMGK